jgi:hypothetical protein
MLNRFWESIGSNIAERWLDYVFGPAFLFWAGGLALYAWKTGWQAILRRLQALDPFQQASWIVLALLLLVFSSVLMQALRFPILRFLEGYWPWPLSYLGEWIVMLQKPGFQKKTAELHQLASEDLNKLNARQREKLSSLETWAHWHPVKSKDLLPLPLGNILRAREYSPARKYGLDAMICWPRLWPLLPENLRTDLASARSALDRLAELCFWGLLFLFWAILVRWAILIALLWIFITYHMACQSAMSYGDLLEAAFDLYRFSLYDAMGWPRPKSTQTEPELGSQLTEHMWRGTLPKPLTYRSKQK